ncbi:MAG: putative transposase [Pseudomonadota bacterium]|nr:putative transposase [Pseudomonadota bacterium]
MLNDEEILNLYTKQQIPLNGRAVVNAIRKSNPARRVGGGSHNVVTRFASKKMRCVIQAESHKGELPFVYIKEHDHATYEFYDQPSEVKLSYRSSTGKRTTHRSTPDFFLIEEDFMGWVENKPEDQLQASYNSGSERFVPDGKGGWRCPPGETFAAQFGLKFQVCSHKAINWMLVRNLEFLSDYLDPDCAPPSRESLEAIAERFKAERWMRIRDLLEPENIAADAVYYLVAREELYVDLENELLSEPAFTYICRDALSAEAYRNSRRHTKTQSPVALQTIHLASGTRLLWDGNLWVILNVGNNDVVLEDDQHAISTLRLGTFQALIASGDIVGLPESVDKRVVLSERIMKSAAPVDLEAAVNRNNHIEAAAHGQCRVPGRTLRYWRKRAEEGEVAYGNRFAGLIPRISARGNRERKLNSEVVKMMGEIIEADVLNEAKPEISVAYGKLRNLCEARGHLPPSDKTFRCEIKRVKETRLIEARNGRKAAYALSEFQWHVDQSTPRHGERPFEIGHIDHTEFDVDLVDSRTGANLGRPWLTVLMDAFTRVILAFYLTFDPPSYRSCMAVIRNCVRRHGRIPKTIVVDQGSDFESLFFEALLARLETHKKSRPASKGRFGSVIERFFGVSNQRFVHNLAGNSQALQQARSMSPSHDPRTLAVWTLPALTDAFEEFAFEVYGNLTHPAFGMSPNQSMAQGQAVSGSRSHILIPFTPDFERLCMPTTPAQKAVVRPGRGIKIRNIHYWHPLFREAKVERTKVPLVYDPFDVSRAYALANG